MHPKTGKVCVPLDPATADAFDPEAVPTVGSLLNELNANGSGAMPGTKASNNLVLVLRRPASPRAF